MINSDGIDVTMHANYFRWLIGRDRPKAPQARRPMNELDVALAAKSFLDAGPQDQYDPYVMGAVGAFAYKHHPSSSGLCRRDITKSVVRQSLAIFTAQHNAALCC